MGETTLTWSAYKKKPGTWIVAIEVHVEGRRTHDLAVISVEVMREREMRRVANSMLALWQIRGNDYGNQ